MIQAKWTDILFLEPSIIVVDMKYATEDNFVSEKMYDCNRCFLRPEVAEAIADIHHEVSGQIGYRVKAF